MEERCREGERIVRRGRRQSRRRREYILVVGLVFEDGRQGVRREPWRRHNICATLALQKHSKPERYGCSVRWVERG